MSAVQARVRPYRDTDAQPTQELFYRAVRQTAARDYTDEQICAWAAPQPSTREWGLRRASTNTWVAEVQGVVVGFTDLDATGYIDMMYIDPDHARQGIAARLRGTSWASPRPPTWRSSPSMPASRPAPSSHATDSPSSPNNPRNATACT